MCWADYWAGRSAEPMAEHLDELRVVRMAVSKAVLSVENLVASMVHRSAAYLVAGWVAYLVGM